MGDNRTDLPEGTDAIIAGASSTDDTTGATGSANAGAMTTESTLVTETDLPTPRNDEPTSGGAPQSGLRQRLRDGGERLSTEAGDRARGLEHSAVEVAPYAAVERTPELDPESYNDTNRMKLHVFANDERAQAVLVAVYDNLGKGASGAAVQNLNLMLGVAADTSLAA